MILRNTPYLFFATGFLLLLIIICAVQLPIYPDEIAYKIFLERYFINGGYKQSVTPYCSEGFLFDPPFLLRPAAAFWTVPYWLGIDWVSYRLLPVLALCSFSFVFIKEYWKSRNANAALALCAIGIGPAMFGLIVFRPEVFILCGCAVIYWIFLQTSKMPSNWKLTGYYIGALFIYSLLIYLHPKALYLLPFVIVAFANSGLSSGVSAPRAIVALGCVAFVILLGMQATVMHKIQFLTCSEYPEIVNAMNRQSVNLLQVLRGDHSAFDALKLLVSQKHWLRIFSQIAFNPVPDVNYLPAPPELLVIKGTNAYLQVTVIGMFVFCCFMSIKSFFNVIKNKRFELILKPLLFFGMVMPFVLSLSKNWYDAAEFVAALGFMTSLFILDLKHTRATLAIACSCFVAAVLSLALLLVYYVPAFNQGFTGPSIPISVDRGKINSVVESMLKQHNVPEQVPIIIDDWTYEAEKHHPIVLPITYLSIGMTHPEIVMKTLERLGVKYGVVHSNSLAQIISSRPEFKTVDKVEVDGNSFSLFSLTFSSEEGHE